MTEEGEASRDPVGSWTTLRLRNRRMKKRMTRTRMVMMRSGEL